MRGSFKSGRRRGVHFDLVLQALEILRRTSFHAKTRNERELEHTMVTALSSNEELRPHILTQLHQDPVEKVAPADLLGFQHRPDAAIGRDGTALELKIIKSSQDIRLALGQAMVYRIAYRFVIMVLMDKTNDQRMLERAVDSDRPGNKMLAGLADDFGIFTVVGPRTNINNKKRKEPDNLVFGLEEQQE